MHVMLFLRPLHWTHFARIALIGVVFAIFRFVSFHFSSGMFILAGAAASEMSRGGGPLIRMSAAALWLVWSRL